MEIEWIFNFEGESESPIADLQNCIQSLFLNFTPLGIAGTIFNNFGPFYQ